MEHTNATGRPSYTSGVLANHTTSGTHGNSSSLLVDDTYNYVRYTTIVLLVVASYIFTVLTWYEIRRKNILSFQASHFLILSSFFTIMYCVSQLLEVWVGQIPCTTYRWMNAFIFAIALGSGYSAVWVRQRKLYSDPLLVHTVSKTSKVLSLVIIVFIHLTIFTGSIVSVYNYTFSNVPSIGCVVVYSDSSVSTAVLPIVIIAMVGEVVFQIILVVLIMYPLITNKGSNGKQPANRVKQTKDIRQMLWRLTICASICIITWIGVNIILYLSSKAIVQVFTPNISVLGLITNTLVIVLSFVHWRPRLFPMLYVKRGMRYSLRSSIQHDVAL